jgi:hypothetical protein
MSADPRRPRWLRCRRGVLVGSACGALMLAGTVYWMCWPSPVQRLQSYVGQDLRNLSEDEQIHFDRLMASLVPDAKTLIEPDRPQTWNPKNWYDYYQTKPSSFWLPECRYLWRVANEQRQERVVLFQGMPLDTSPGGSSAHIFVLDLDGKLLSKSEFLAGWHVHVGHAHGLEDSGHGFKCLRLSCSRVMYGVDITAQYYAFHDDAFALVRLEDSAGKLVPVWYHAANASVGPPVPKRTPEEWEVALRSPDRVEVLRTLVWLGGWHSDQPASDGEQPEDAARALATRARPGVRAAVDALAGSEDSWVQEAAEQTLEAIRASNR